MKYFEKHPYLTAFLLSTLLGLLVILPSIISGKGIFYFIGDYNEQEIPFNVHINEEFKKNGLLSWEPHNDLGASFIGSYSFYNLASVFAAILFIVPIKLVPYLMGPMLAIKFGIAGLTAFMFISRIVKDKKYALLGSLFYAFSGFQFTNILFFHFHDCVALFPLLLYALDRLIKEDKKMLFCLIVALNLFTNYFFFIGEVVFVLIYYIILNLTKYYKFTWKKFFEIAFESILGVGLAAIILIPSISFVVNNPRVEMTWTLHNMILPPPTRVLEIIRALVFPNESMTFHSVLYSSNFGSVEAYLPLVGSILWLTYILKKPKNSFSILTMVLLVFSLIPILNSTFTALTTTYYARWFYMLTLILALLSAKTLDEVISPKRGFIITAVLSIMLISFYILMPDYIFYKKLLVVILGFFLLNFLYLAVVCKKNAFKMILIGTCTYIILFGNYFCFMNRYMVGSNNPLESYKNLDETISKFEDDVRYNGTAMWNGNYYANKMSITNWNSNIEGSSFEFYNSIGIVRGVATLVDLNEDDLQDFLSVKYIYSNSDLDESKNYKLIEENNGFKIYENKDYISFGIDYKTYITQDEFNLLDTISKKKVLKEAVVLSELQIKDYGDIINHYDGQKRDSDIISNDFKLVKNGFNANINLNKDSFIVYTFAYSDNLKAKVNGIDVKLEKVDNGLIGLKLKEGINHIEITYKDKGLYFGTIITLISLSACIIYAIVIYRIKTRRGRSHERKS